MKATRKPSKKSAPKRSKQSKSKQSKALERANRDLKTLATVIPNWRRHRDAFAGVMDLLELGGELCPIYTVSPLAPHWGDAVTLDVVGLPNFGLPGSVWLLAGPNAMAPVTRVEATVTSWTLTSVRITLPAAPLAGGPPYWIQAPNETCPPRAISIFDVTNPSCPLFTVTPTVAFWGDDIALRTVLSPNGFGSATGTVTLTGQGNQTENLTVSSWGEAEVVVALPATAPFAGPYRVRVLRDGTKSACAPTADPILVLTDRPRVFKVTLLRLVCCATEDWLGDDECRLDVKVVAGGPNIMVPNRKDMNDGDVWQINWELMPFTMPLIVTLWDEDLGHFPDQHDKLGERTIPVVATSESRVRFCSDGADYYLYYKVEDVL